MTESKFLSIGFPSVSMDIDHNSSLVEAENNDSQSRILFDRNTGMLSSANEHIIPELIFSTPENPIDGISAIKALNIAMGEGQKVYTLTQNKMEQLIDIIVDSDARAEICSALLTGKEVTVHARPINAYGWSGSGYIIFDPISGSGAYKISGGANGGETDLTGWRCIGASAGVGYLFGFFCAWLAAGTLATGGILGGVVLLAIGLAFIAIGFMLLIEYMFHETAKVKHTICRIAWDILAGIARYRIAKEVWQSIVGAFLGDFLSPCAYVT